ncbi:unnamed protein product [Rotaria sp. Silwood2]|nr:unnamed protein product [Rotaria sp. Silwood2]CAF3092927.1 unnamed protein product [Rotaria sp. Silwood2]CAF3373325.1 unnamed protein product [Rotaria sp. Silwood2]CAF4311808.1 unnamed protein product [Rotaria sp. Silwood2]CAF4379619.1 unnamed protein product [Rotaria sp. Silwood2]
MKYSNSTKNQDFFHLVADQSPQSFLNTKSHQWQLQLNTKQFAIRMHNEDPLAHMRRNFFYPKMATLPNVDKNRIKSNDECIYLCGQSLGLMPVRTVEYMSAFMNDWASLGVYGHFMGSNPWAKCDSPCIPVMSLLVGAQIKEVAVMNQLSSNLHFMMTAFYQPKDDRYKILYEEHAFPSDQYAINSQIKMRGYDPKDAKIILKARKGENCLRIEDILDILRREGHSIALVMFGGVHYYTGQLFDIETITRIAHEQGCCVGWDLAHAVGNVPLHLHDWQVDFAVWCTYKYLNSGAGCIGGIFVHINHFKNDHLTTLDGWWGNRESTRFSMLDNIDRDNGANGFRVSNPSIHQCATLAASLENFEEVGIDQLRAKSVILTQYLQYLLKVELQDTGICQFTLLTPSNAQERGAQLSLRPHNVTAQQIHDELEKVGVVIDIRDDIIRVAPTPLYNSFLDVFHFVSLFKEVVIQLTAMSDK